MNDKEVVAENGNVDLEFEAFKRTRTEQAKAALDADACAKEIQAALDKYGCALYPFNQLGQGGIAIPNIQVVKKPKA